jgi:hypothetical protein
MADTWRDGLWLKVLVLPFVSVFVLIGDYSAFERGGLLLIPRLKYIHHLRSKQYLRSRQADLHYALRMGISHLVGISALVQHLAIHPIHSGR